MQIYPQIQNFSLHLWHPDTDIGTKIFSPSKLKNWNLVYVQSGKAKWEVFWKCNLGCLVPLSFGNDHISSEPQLIKPPNLAKW